VPEQQVAAAREPDEVWFGDLLGGVEAAVVRAVEAVRRADDEGRPSMSSSASRVRFAATTPSFCIPATRRLMGSIVCSTRSTFGVLRRPHRGTPPPACRRWFSGGVIGATFIIVHRRNRSSSPGKRILGTSMGSR